MKKVVIIICSILFVCIISIYLFIKTYSLIESPSRLEELYELAQDEYNNNNLPIAIQYSEEALALIEQMYGKDHPDYATTLDNIATCYSNLGDYNKAIEYYNELITIQEKTIGTEHQDYATTLNNIALCYYELGEYDHALEYHYEALRIREVTLGVEHSDYAISLNNIALCYYNIGDYNNAIDLYFNALYILDDTERNYATALSNLANCYIDLGDYNKALEIHNNAIEIKEQTIGKEHPDYAVSLCNIATCFNELGEYNKAIEYHSNALKILENSVGYKHPNYATVLNNIGLCYFDLGNYNKAFEIHSEAASINEQVLGSEHPNYALDLNNIALCYYRLGDYNNALEYLDQARIIQEKTIGVEHLDYLNTINNIAMCLSDLGDYNAAIEIHTEALALLEKILGEEHPVYALSLNNIAMCYHDLGNNDRAIEYLYEVLSIYGNIFGKEHADYQFTLQNISACYLESHNNAFSKTAKEFTELNIASICKTFIDLSLNERKLFWDKHSYWYDGPIHQGVCEFNDASLLPTAYNSVLFSKGLLLNAEIAMRDLLEESNDPAATELYNELLSTRSVLNKQYELAPEKRYISTDSLEKRADELERQLINTSKVYGDYTRNLQLNWKDVQNHISDNDIAIEFASFSDENTTTYIAYLLKKGYKTPAYKKILTHNNNENLNNSEIYLSAEFSKTLWGALREELSGVENIYFAPTGELYNIAIESLPYWENPSMLVSDKWNFFRLSSTRELALNKEKYNSKSAAVYGGLKYDTATNQLSTTDEFNYNPLDVDAIGLRSGVEYLPGSHNEALLIDKLLKSNKVNDKLYLGEVGTETTLKALGGEYVNILHIATHGFYWTEREARRMDFQFLNNQNKNVEDKMLSRSGLLFAGANNILSGKEIPGNIDDGVLTAEEISRIDLRGLDLLVLSACQTGLGEISGEGVFGLQRGFKKAGAQSILMSLWNVDDKATQLLMSKFYELLLADKDNPHNKRNAHLNAQQFVKNYEIDMNSISSHELEYYKENGAAINYNTGKVKPFCNHKFWAAFILLDAI